MAPIPQMTASDPELGPMRYCRACTEWWPDDDEFWIDVATRPVSRICKACHRRRNREQEERRQAALQVRRAQEANKRNQGLCVVGECPVSTPRDRCYFHARVLVA